MRRLVVLAVPMLLLAACGGGAQEETQTTVTKNGVTTTTITRRAVGHDDRRAVAIADGDTGSGLNIDSDKFKANVEIPGLSFGGDRMNLDGMKLYPGSTVKGMHVHAVDRPGAEKGEVVITFASPAAPLEVARHMAGQAQANGFALKSNTAAEVSGSKAGDDGTHRFDMTLHPNGDGTVGQLTMTGTGD